MNAFNESKFDEEKMEIYQIVAESAFDIMYEDAYEDEMLEDDTYTEGANLEIRSYLKQLKKEYKMYMKEIKRARIANDYDRAVKSVEKLKEITDKYVKAIEITKSTTGSFIFGWFTSWTVNFLRNLGLSLLMPFTFAISGVVRTIFNFIETWGRPLGKLAAHDDDFSIRDDFNKYKNVSLSGAKKIQKLVRELERKVKEEAAEYKKTGSVRMSPDKAPSIKKINFKKESVNEITRTRMRNAISELREFEGGD